MSQVLPPRYKVGDKVQIKSADREVGKVAEVVLPERPGGRTIYRVRVRTTPDLIEVEDEELQKTCLPETGAPATGEEDPVHPTPTRRSEYCYKFTDKHHGGGKWDDARWLPDLSRPDEFTVFDTADYHSIADAQGWLYGMLRGIDGKLRELGTWQQQVATFPFANPGQLWHGYPIWAVNKFIAPPNRADNKMMPPKAVFRQMERVGIITKRERKKFEKGDCA